MEGQFLIPANSKKSMLIFGIFTPFDLILFGTGVGITLILLMIMPLTNFGSVVISLFPVLTTALLVFPIANYHNTLTVLILIYHFFTERQKFIWKGWCSSDGTKDTITDKK